MITHVYSRGGVVLPCRLILNHHNHMPNSLSRHSMLFLVYLFQSISYSTHSIFYELHILVRRGVPDGGVLRVRHRAEPDGSSNLRPASPLEGRPTPRCPRLPPQDIVGYACQPRQNAGGLVSNAIDEFAQE